MLMETVVYVHNMKIIMTPLADMIEMEHECDEDPRFRPYYGVVAFMELCIPFNCFSCRNISPSSGDFQLEVRKIL